MKIERAAATHVGRDRDENDDGVWIDEARAVRALRRDGRRLGSGRYATELAIAAVRERLDEGGLDPRAVLDDATRALLVAVNAAIFREQGRGRYGRGFACSSVLLAARGDEAVLAFAGACHALRVRDEACEVLAAPHDLAWKVHQALEHVDFAAIAITPRNVIANLLGLSLEPTIESALEVLRRDDVFVLCSDPVIEQVSPGELTAIVRAHERVQAMADAIVALEVARGGAANATALVVRVTG